MRRKNEGVAIRVMRQEDASAVTEILRGAPEAANWSEQSLNELLTWDGAVALVSETEGAITGFILGRALGEEAEVFNLGVLPANRRMGEGTALLKATLDVFQAQGAQRVFLEVRESNEVAISFYAKHGFAKTGRRPNYYPNWREAAILMEKKLML